MDGVLRIAPAQADQRAYDAEPEGPARPWTFADDFLPHFELGGRIDPTFQDLQSQMIASLSYLIPGPYGRHIYPVPDGPWVGRLSAARGRDNFYSRRQLRQTLELQYLQNSTDAHLGAAVTNPNLYDMSIRIEDLLLTRDRVLARLADDAAAQQRAAVPVGDGGHLALSVRELLPLTSVKVTDPIGLRRVYVPANPPPGLYPWFFCREPITAPQPCQRDTNEWCEDTRHPQLLPDGPAREPFWVCKACDHTSKTLILDRHSHGLDDVQTSLNLRMYFCSYCTPGLSNKSAWRGSGFRVWFRGVEDDPDANPVDGQGYGGFMPDGGFGAGGPNDPVPAARRHLPAITGCSCSAKLLYRTLCQHHRLSLADAVVRAAGLQREWVLTVYGTGNVCPRCLKPGGGMTGGPAGGVGSVCEDVDAEALADPPAPLVVAWSLNKRWPLPGAGAYHGQQHLAYICLACQDRVVGPADTVHREIRWPDDSMDPMLNPPPAPADAAVYGG